MVPSRHRVLSYGILLGGLLLALMIGPGKASAELTSGDHVNLTLAFGGELRLYDVHVPAGYDVTSPVASGGNGLLAPR